LENISKSTYTADLRNRESNAHSCQLESSRKEIELIETILVDIRFLFNETGLINPDIGSNGRMSSDNSDRYSNANIATTIETRSGKQQKHNSKRGFSKYFSILNSFRNTNTPVFSGSQNSVQFSSKSQSATIEKYASLEIQTDLSILNSTIELIAQQPVASTSQEQSADRGSIKSDNRSIDKMSRGVTKLHRKSNRGIASIRSLFIRGDKKNFVYGSSTSKTLEKT